MDRASAAPGIEMLNTIVNVATESAILQPYFPLLGTSVRKLFEAYGVGSPAEAVDFWATSPEFFRFRAGAGVSNCGQWHRYHPDAMSAIVAACFCLAHGNNGPGVDGWLDSIPPADSSTLHCVLYSTTAWSNAVVSIAQVVEKQGRLADACKFAHACLANKARSLCLPSKASGGRVLGRAHALLGEHDLSAAAFDAAIELARSRGFVWSEFLAVKDRVEAGRGAQGVRGHHWPQAAGQQRLTEVLARMELREEDRAALAAPGGRPGCRA